jgi:hypothetical protein
MPSANVLLLPEPGSGHLMSLIEAGKRLIGHGGSDALTVTVLIIRPATAESAAEVDAHVSRVAASGSGPTWAIFISGRASRGPTAASLRKEWPAVR